MKIVCEPWRANPAYLKPAHMKPKIICGPWLANPDYLKPALSAKTPSKRPKQWTPKSEPGCLECWGLRHMFKRNAPKCVVCRGEVPERVLAQRTRFGTDSKVANKGHAASRKVKAAKMAKTG